VKHLFFRLLPFEVKEQIYPLRALFQLQNMTTSISTAFGMGRGFGMGVEGGLGGGNCQRLTKRQYFTQPFMSPSTMSKP